MTGDLLRLQRAPQQFFATMLSTIITEHTERNCNTSLHASSDDSQLAQDVDVYIPENDDTLVEEENLKCNPTVIGTKSLIDTASLPPPLQSTCTNNYDGIHVTSGGAATAPMADPGGDVDAPQNSEVTSPDDAEKNSSLDHELYLDEIKGDVIRVDGAIVHTNILQGTSSFHTDVPATSFSKESSGAIDDFSNSIEVARSPLVTDHCYPLVPDMVDEVPQTDEAPLVDAATMGEPTVPVTLGKVTQAANPELVDPVSVFPDETPAIMPPLGLEGSLHDSMATLKEVVLPDVEHEMGSNSLSNPIDAKQSPSVDPESSLSALSDCWDELPNSDDPLSMFCFVPPIMPISAHNGTVGANTLLSFVEREFCQTYHGSEMTHFGLIRSRRV